MMRASLSRLLPASSLIVALLTSVPACSALTGTVTATMSPTAHTVLPRLHVTSGEVVLVVQVPDRVVLVVDSQRGVRFGASTRPSGRSACIHRTCTRFMCSATLCQFALKSACCTHVAPARASLQCMPAFARTVCNRCSADL